MKKPLVAAVCLTLVVLYASFLNERLRIGGDAVDYLRLADSLVEGRGYQTNGQFMTKWPPVTSAVLAVGKTFLGSQLTALKALNALLALGGLWLAFAYLRRCRELPLAVVGTVLAAVSFPLIYWAVAISSEPSYLLLTMGALLSGQIALEAESGRIRWAFIAGTLMGLSVLTRTAGLSLLLGWLVYAGICVLREKRVSLATPAVGFAVGLGVIAAWYGYSWTQSGKTSVSAYKYAFGRGLYDDDETARGSSLATTIDRVRENAVGYVFIFCRPDASLRSQEIPRLTWRGGASATLIGLSLAGFLYHLVRKPRFAECYILVYVGVLLVINWYCIRYLVPVFPFFFYYLCFSIRHVSIGLTAALGVPQGGRPLAAAGILTLLLLNVTFSIAGGPARRMRSAEYDGDARDLYHAAMWAKDHYPNAVIMCRWANMVRFWTGQETIGVPLKTDPDAMWDCLCEHRVGLVIVDPDDFSGVTGTYLQPALDTYGERHRLAHARGRAKIYVIEWEAVPAAGTRCASRGLPAVSL